jgi:hypothetical protein
MALADINNRPQVSLTELMALADINNRPQVSLLLT